ncbi:hypothetical protein ACLOJK_004019 [Asimina triloba]
MSTVIAFEFVPRGGFALGTYDSFDLASPHHFIHVPSSLAWKTYRYTDYSLMAIVLVTKENWMSIAAATAAPQLPHKVAFAFTALAIHWHTRKATTFVATPTHKVAASMAATTVFDHIPQ